MTDKVSSKSLQERALTFCPFEGGFLPPHTQPCVYSLQWLICMLPKWAKKTSEMRDVFTDVKKIRGAACNTAMYG